MRALLWILAGLAIWGGLAVAAIPLWSGFVRSGGDDQDDVQQPKDAPTLPPAVTVKAA